MAFAPLLLVFQLHLLLSALCQYMALEISISQGHANVPPLYAVGTEGIGGFTRWEGAGWTYSHALSMYSVYCTYR